MTKNKNISNARSKDNGIIFYSNKIPSIGTETFYDVSGDIKHRIAFARLEIFFDYLGTHSKNEIKFSKKKMIIFDVCIIILSIIGFIFTKNFGFILAALYFCAFISSDFLKAAKISYQMKSKKGKKYSTAKFHSAEHMAVNAYEKLQRIPTLEEIKKFSRFSKKCGSRLLLSRVFVFSLLSISFLIPDILIRLLIILLVFLVAILEKKFSLLRFLQFFVTNKPTDKELALAIEGLKNFEIFEKILTTEDFASME